VVFGKLLGVDMITFSGIATFLGKLLMVVGGSLLALTIIFILAGLAFWYGQDLMDLIKRIH